MAGQRRRRPAAGSGANAAAARSNSFDSADAAAPVSPPSITRIKILSMGPKAAGKSCLVKRYCEGRFVSKYISTIGVDYGVKPVQSEGRDLRVNFWDLSGHPEFFEIRNEFYKDSQGALLVFDAGSRDSFDSLDDWIAEAQRFGVRDIPIALCGNKCDKRRVIQDDEAQAWAQANGCHYFDTSAQSGLNVQEVFEWLFQSVTDHQARGLRRG
eukprot:CAMPEP_0118871640 /NCGR_PEP_ID=MMETSP1163-20130328/14129_1 /TAXON_ID=124430 /ORGANISM="Phaeomonas parva, Strain CCMP2877" /LENGTH=211 /DNA_ID=CAMNT_0006806757 /DNA_START=285 /DNA_END=920 /DNA_ORIENTATION=+